MGRWRGLVGRERWGVVAGMSALWSAAVTGVAQAAPADTLYLRLDEARGASVAVDSSGRLHHGSIGAHIVMGDGGALFDYHAPDAGVSFGSAHLVMVPDASDASLDPGSSNFSVEVRYRTTHRFGNIVQKGQNAASGGQVKIENPNGIPTCLFKSPTGQAGVSACTALNDGNWHTLRCVRNPNKRLDVRGRSATG